MTNKFPQAAYKAGSKDQCQTPPYALDPLVPYLPPHKRFWDPAAGEGKIVRTMQRRGFDCIGTELLESDDKCIQGNRDFLEDAPPQYDVIITNPPYSFPLWARFVARCYELDRPWAMLMKTAALGTANMQSLIQDNTMTNFAVMLLDQRVHFKMPEKGYLADGAQFSVSWFTWGLLPDPIMFGRIQYAPDPDEPAWTWYPWDPKDVVERKKSEYLRWRILNEDPEITAMRLEQARSDYE